MRLALAAKVCLCNDMWQVVNNFLLTNVRLHIFALMIKEKKASRKQEIARRATELFMQKGYAATSMRDLANALGIEAASLYSHIKSKEEILRNICFRMADEFFEAMTTVNVQGLTAAEKLKRATVAHLSVITKDTPASAVFFHEWRHLSQPYLDEFLQMRTDYEQRFIDIITEGIDSGEFRPIDNKFGMLYALSSINWVHHWYKPDGKMSIDEVSNELASLLIAGLKHKNGI